MKKYEPEALVASSRYRVYFPTLPVEIQRDVYSRMRVLLEEEKRWCDKGNYKHIAQILTSIALYEVLQQHGKAEEEAFRIVSTEMWKQLTPDTYRKLARHSWFLPVMKKILPFGFRHGSGAGWRYEWHLDTDPKNYTAEQIETALKTAGFSEVSSDHHPSRPWITVIARK